MTYLVLLVCALRCVTIDVPQPKATLEDCNAGAPVFVAQLAHPAETTIGWECESAV